MGVIRSLESVEITVARSFWKGKRVLITGHTGFKGSWLTLWLDQLGAKVTGYALPPPTQPSLFVDARLKGCVSSVLGDIRDSRLLAKTIKVCKPQIIIHMAAQPLVRASYVEPVETFDVNVQGTVAILEAARDAKGLRVIVNVTTDKVYENHELDRGYHEADRLGGFDPYSSSKACSEIVTASYRSAFFNPDQYAKHGVAVATARSGNVIGGGDWAVDRLIPDLMRGFIECKPVMIRYPQAVRPWQHVLDPLSGYMLLAEQLFVRGPEMGGAWNFGPPPNLGKTVAWVADRLVAQWGSGAAWKTEGGVHVHETQNLRLDSRRARTVLGWKSGLTVEQTLRLVTEWYRASAARDDLAVLTRTQVKAYGNMIR
jgi:CDP-glucose 4,6-dehydratase